MSTSVDRIAKLWGSRNRSPCGRDEPWPVRVDTSLAGGTAPKDVEPVVPDRLDPALRRRRDGRQPQGPVSRQPLLRTSPPGARRSLPSPIGSHNEGDPLD
ncbi:hypothetical protein GCM10010253_07930 [Streptomyces badius]|uniref:Uncharacterized protein n=1 Tax=Streptomyces badius TaxID=1941 RepID=A0ABQ2SST0_STRBA|nr:hypothetical protein GCM10010253_07930 [Streptomyces badius]